ncbi:MAG: LamG-like jellyroll fold domain-containing protein [bacterium]
MKFKRKAFTLIEILLIVSLLAILSVIVIVALNPVKWFAEMRNSERRNDAKSVLDALWQYKVDNNGVLPLGVDNSLRMLGTDTTNCNIVCGGGSGGSSSNGTISDSNQANFQLGSFFHMQWNTGSNVLEMTNVGKTAGAGSYTSRIFDAGAPVSWSNFSWSPAKPVKKQLPNNAQSESGYASGNANMTSNVLLMHMDEASGNITDYSGKGHNGTAAGGITYKSNGIYNSSLLFNGSSGRITVPYSSDFFPTNQITIEAWLKWNIVPSTGLQWASIVNTNADNGYRLQHNSTNTLFEIAVPTTSSPGSGRWIWSTTAPQMGVWYYVVGVYDGSYLRMYVNGVQESYTTLTGTIIPNSSPLYISQWGESGRYFNGNIDEVAIYSRALSATEIADRYARGSTDLNFQVRSCSDSACTGKSFIGPDGTSSTYYSEINNSGSTPPTFNFSSLSGRYFQYKADFTTINSNLSSQVKSVSGAYTVPATNTTQTSCLDISSSLVPKYMAFMPFSPKGTASKTYFAVKKNDAGRIEVVSCDPELNEVIDVSR